MRELLQKATLASTLLLAPAPGCMIPIDRESGPDYATQEIHRPHIDNTAQSWRDFYNSIENLDNKKFKKVIRVSKDEKDIAERAVNRIYSKNDMDSLFSQIPDDFDFLNRDDPSMRDVFFAEYYLTHQNNN